jgi:WhiB family transcriptional regulator, redox-sensing transcriptional regulator
VDKDRSRNHMVPERGTNTSWLTDAVCRNNNIATTLFFPEPGKPSESEVAAKRLCGICPVANECLRYAVDHHIQHGIWGGLNRRERKALRRREIMFDIPA